MSHPLRRASAVPQWAAAKALPKIVNDDPFGAASAKGKKKKGGAARKKQPAARGNLHRLRR
jgi:hypothetical protein